MISKFMYHNETVYTKLDQQVMVVRKERLTNLKYAILRYNDHVTEIQQRIINKIERAYNKNYNFTGIVRFTPIEQGELINIFNNKSLFLGQASQNAIKFYVCHDKLIERW